MNSPSPSEEQSRLLVRVTATPEAAWVQVRGEVDLANLGQLRSALCAVDLDGSDGVHLVLDELTFCDIAGCRLLLLFEREARLSGHPTSVRAPRPTLRRVLSLVAADDPVPFV